MDDQDWKMGIPKVFHSKESYDEAWAMSLERCLAPRAVSPLVPFLEGLWVSGLGGRFQDLWKNWSCVETLIWDTGHRVQSWKARAEGPSVSIPKFFSCLCYHPSVPGTSLFLHWTSSTQWMKVSVVLWVPRSSHTWPDNLAFFLLW